jgi:GntR family transcriptional regulator
MTDMQTEASADDEADKNLRAALPHRQSATLRAIESLRLRLLQEAWSPGDRLPSEVALAKDLGVSRVSIRGALAQLAGEGILSRRHGSGTYVNSVRPLVRSLHLNVGSDELIRSRGHAPGISEMSWRYEAASESVSERLGIVAGSQVVHLYRVRTSDGQPVTISNDYLASALIPDQPLVLGPSLYSFLSVTCGIDVKFGVATLEPSVITESQAAVFDVDAGGVCLKIQQVDYDLSERPVSYSIEYHLASASDFNLIRQGPATPGAHPLYAPDS